MKSKRKSWALSDANRNAMRSRTNNSLISKKPFYIVDTSENPERFQRYIRALGKFSFTDLEPRERLMYDEAHDRCIDVEAFITEIEGQENKNAYLALNEIERKSAVEQNQSKVRPLYSGKKANSHDALLEKYESALDLAYFESMSPKEIAAFELAYCNCDDVMEFIREIKGQSEKDPYKALTKTERKGTAVKWG